MTSPTGSIETTGSPFSACVVAMWRSMRKRKSSGVTTTKGSSPYLAAKYSGERSMPSISQ